MKHDKPVLCDSLSWLEHPGDQLNDIVAELLLKDASNFDKNYLDQTTKVLL